ncbi:hypothetical protein KIK84_06445 [Curvibacter sp. CHRR-16]|uniref:hypothetical protein n=1 Tax=Curvibacter sp. CHRR-16 TaxID=2835872 RepID=UPI001BD9BA3F|nr:hypothetical protein [Curvibacter sp. CHRR-16]MBT0569959.1 hypothetical protein [Curvibacter sp. CHRR-16]
MTKAFFTPRASSMACLAMAGLAALSAPAWALQDYAKVVASQPLVQAVTTPQQVCTTQTVAVQQPKSGVGAAVGAVAGAVLGGSLARGPASGATAAAGMVAGAVVGDSLESSNTQTQQVQSCSTQMRTEYKTVAYQVTYEYGGKQYSAQVNKAPVNNTLEVFVNESNYEPTPVDIVTAASTATTVTTVAPATTVVVQEPVYVPRVAVPVYVWPVGPGPGWGWHRRGPWGPW